MGVRVEALFSLAWGSKRCKETNLFSGMLLVLCFLEVLSLFEVLGLFGKQDLPKQERIKWSLHLPQEPPESTLSRVHL